MTISQKIQRILRIKSFFKFKKFQKKKNNIQLKISTLFMRL
jgi:hypothetical protein